MSEPPGVLFVCRANICRSPMAESIFNDLARERGVPFAARSAGVEARRGFDMAPNTRTVLQEMGFSAGEHRSRPVTGDMISGAVVVLTMSRNHSEVIRQNFGDDVAVMTLPEFTGDFAERDISDPYQLTTHAYRAAARRILGYVESGLDRLSRT